MYSNYAKHNIQELQGDQTAQTYTQNSAAIWPIQRTIQLLSPNGKKSCMDNNPQYTEDSASPANN